MTTALAAAALLAHCRGGSGETHEPDATSASTGAALESPPATSSGPDGSELARSLDLDVRPALPPDADGVTIHVVQEATRRPVADALVVVVDEREFCQPAWGVGGEEGELAGQLKKLGTAYCTDATGTTRVTVRGVMPGVYAMSRGQFGRTYVEPFDRADHEISIASRDLRIMVVDKKGTPQPNVPIAMGACVIEKDVVNAWRGVTGSDGSITLPALDLVRHVHYTCGRHAVVGFAFPAHGCVTRQIDAPRIEPVQLVLPECGALEVELDDVAGRPMRGEAWFRVSAEVGGAGSLTFRAVDGQITLERVELGLQLGLGGNGKNLQFEDETLAGPTVAGERKKVVLHPRHERDDAAEKVVVSGIAVDEQQAPLRRVELNWCVGAGFPGLSGPSIVTDDAGRFELVAGENQLRYDARIQLRESQPIGAPRSFRSSETHAANGGRIDLGVAMLQTVPLLVRGRVVDETGAPAAGRYVRILEVDQGQPHRTVSMNSSGRQVYPFLSSLLTDDVETDASGAFEIRDWPPKVKLQASVRGMSRRSMDSDPVPFEPGAADLQLVSPTSSSIEVTVRFDDAGQRWRDEFFDPWQLSLGFRRRYWTSPANGFDEKWGEFDSTGHLIDASFDPGIYDLVFHVWTPGHGDTTLQEVDEVAVRSHQHVRDSRLIDVDLRGRLCPHLVEVVDVDGRRLDGEVRFPPAPPDPAPPRMSVEHGVCNVVTLPDEPTRCTICVPRFRPVELPSLGRHERVVLRRGIPIRVELDPNWKPPKPDVGVPTARAHFEVAVSESPRAGSSPEAEEESGQGIELEPGGAARFVIPEPGERPVRLTMEIRDGETTYGGSPSVVPLREPTLHILDSDVEQLFVLEPLASESEDESARSNDAGRGR